MTELTQELIEEMRKINLILKVAFKEELNEAFKDVKADPVSKEILERLATKEDTSTNLKKEIAEKLGISEKTVERRLLELAERGLLIQTPSGKTFKYKSLGLI